MWGLTCKQELGRKKTPEASMPPATPSLPASASLPHALAFVGNETSMQSYNAKISKLKYKYN